MIRTPGLWAISGLRHLAGGHGGILLLGILGLATLGLGIVMIIRVRPSVIVTVAVVLMVFSSNWKYMHIPVPLDHVFSVAGIVAAIYRAASRRHPERFVLRPLHLLLALTLLYTIISALWSGTLSTSTNLFAIIDAVGIIPYALFALAPVIFVTRRDRQALIAGLFVLGLYLGVTSVGETLHIHALVVPSYINDPHIGLHATRVRGPFLEASPEGFALFTTGLVAAWVGMRTARPGLRLLSAFIVLCCLLGTFGTVTRAVWIGCAAAAVTAMVLAPRVRRYTIPGVLGIAVVIVLAFFLVPGLSSQAMGRTNSQRPIWDRYNSNRAALNMFKARPLLGQGFGTFATKSDPFYQRVYSYPLTFVNAVHNVYLDRFAELGFLGGSLWLISLLLALGQAVRGRRSGDMMIWRVLAISAFVNFAINAGFVPLDYAFCNGVLWLLMGISATPVMAARIPSPRATPDPLPSFEELAIPEPRPYAYA